MSFYFCLVIVLFVDIKLIHEALHGFYIVKKGHDSQQNASIMCLL